MISVVIHTMDPGRFERASQHYRQALAGEEIEIVGAAGPSVAAAYNRAREHARGDIVVFTCEDVELLAPGCARRLRAHLAEQDLIAALGTTRLVCAMWNGAGPPYLYGQLATSGTRTPYDVHVHSVPAPLVPGMEALAGPFLAARRDVLERVPFDERTFNGASFHDVDMSLAARRAGLRLAVAADLGVLDLTARVIDGRWEAAALAFMSKWDLFPRGTLRTFLCARVEVHSKQEILEVMGEEEGGWTVRGGQP